MKKTLNFFQHSSLLVFTFAVLSIASCGQQPATPETTSSNKNQQDQKTTEQTTVGDKPTDQVTTESSSDAASTCTSAEPKGDPVLVCIPDADTVPIGFKAKGILRVENLPTGAKTEFIGPDVRSRKDPCTADWGFTVPGGFEKGSSTKTETRHFSVSFTDPKGKHIKLETDCQITVCKPEVASTPR